MNPEDKIKELERKVEELMAWKEKKSTQQLDFPLDVGSLDIISQNVPIYDSKSTSTVTADKSIKVNINGIYYQINVL